MLNRWMVWPALALVLATGRAGAVDYSVEPLKEGPPADAIAPEIADRLAPEGFKVMRGTTRALCEFWPAKQWELRPDFKPSATVLYPLVPGSLVGVMRFERDATDFRNQDIAAGVYTVRYGNQPVDGNHVGTFDTRDFLLLLPAADDTSPEPLDSEDLFAKSAESAESTHPAILPLLKPEATGEQPAMRHLEEPDWWVVRFGDGSSDGKVVLELVVVGNAAE